MIICTLQEEEKTRRVTAAIQNDSSGSAGARQGKSMQVSPWAGRWDVPKYRRCTFRNHNGSKQGKCLHNSFTCVSNSALTPVSARVNGHLWHSTRLLQSVYKQFPAFFSETNHNPLGLPVCLHKHAKIREATGVLNHLDILSIQEKQIKSPTKKEWEKLKTRKRITLQDSIFLYHFNCILNLVIYYFKRNIVSRIIILVVLLSGK